MTRSLIGTLLLVMCAACMQNAPSQSSPLLGGNTVTAPGTFGTNGTVAVPLNYGVHLAGDNEVPSRETRAQGQAIFQLSKDRTELSYKLIATNIENVIAAHIHLAPAGVNGSIVAFLFGTVPPGGGRQTGVLSTGVITVASLIGPLTGQPLEALISAIEAGNTYVNVHTNDGVAPPNTGAGDFPGGEIRGQLP